MSYDWTKIMSNKTTQELFDIVTGKSQLDKEAEKFAEEELNKRNLSLDNKKRIKNKIELENLVREQEEEIKEKTFFGSSSNMALVQFITGIALTIIAINDLFFDFSNQNLPMRIFIVIIAVTCTVILIIRHKKLKKHKSYRKERLKELINEI